MLNLVDDRYMWYYGTFEQFYMILPRPGGFRWLDVFDLFVSLDDIHADKYFCFKSRPLSKLVPGESVFKEY